MSHFKTNPALFARAIIALTLLAGLGFATWLLSTPSLNASSRLAPLTFTSPIGNPQFSLQKTVDNNAPASGDQINYTLSYSTTQPGSQAFNVQLYDFLPAGAQFISSNPSATLYPNGALLFTTPVVGTGTLTATVRIRVPEGHAQIVNHALITADGVTPTIASLLTNITQSPTNWLRLVKAGYPTIQVNGQLVYTLQATNIGVATLNDVTVVDVLPGGVSLGSASPTPDLVTVPMLRWSLGTLAPAQSKTIVITTTAPAATSVITNSAMASAWQNVVTQTLFSTQVTNNAAILHVIKTGSAPTVNVGDTLVYTLSYQNIGNQPATTVRLTDTLPSGVTVIGTSQTPSVSTTQQLVWNLGALGIGQSEQVVVTTTVGGPWNRTLLNLADVTGQAGSFGHHAELSTTIPPLQLYLPLIMK